MFLLFFKIKKKKKEKNNLLKIYSYKKNFKLKDDEKHIRYENFNKLIL